MGQYYVIGTLSNEVLYACLLPNCPSLQRDGWAASDSLLSLPLTYEMQLPLGRRVFLKRHLSTRGVCFPFLLLVTL